MLRPHVEYIQIKDALAADGTVVTAGKGDGEVLADHPRPAPRRVRRVLLARTAPGRRTSSSGAFSGPELWRKAHADFTDCCEPRGSSTHEHRQRKRRVALVGAGVIGTHHGLVLSQLADRLELVAVVDVDGRRAEKLAAERGGRPLRRSPRRCREEDVDIVVVCTPTGRHGEVAIEALDAGKHVIVEKPAEITVAEDRRDHRRPSRRPAPLVTVISQHRFDPATETDARGHPAGRAGPADLRHRLDRLVARAELLRLRRLAGHLGARRRRRADEPGRAHRRPADRRAGPPGRGLRLHRRAGARADRGRGRRRRRGAVRERGAGRAARYHRRLPGASRGCRSTGTGARPSSTTTSWSSSTEPRRGGPEERSMGTTSVRAGIGRPGATAASNPSGPAGTRTGCST